LRRPANGRKPDPDKPILEWGPMEGESSHPTFDRRDADPVRRSDSVSRQGSAPAMRKRGRS